MTYTRSHVGSDQRRRSRPVHWRPWRWVRRRSPPFLPTTESGPRQGRLRCLCRSAVRGWWNLVACCACERQARVEPHALLARYLCLDRGMDLADLARHLRCPTCPAKQSDLPPESHQCPHRVRGLKLDGYRVKPTNVYRRLTNNPQRLSCPTAASPQDLPAVIRSTGAPPRAAAAACDSAHPPVPHQSRFSGGAPVSKPAPGIDMLHGVDGVVRPFANTSFTLRLVKTRR